MLRVSSVIGGDDTCSGHVCERLQVVKSFEGRGKGAATLIAPQLFALMLHSWDKQRMMDDKVKQQSGKGVDWNGRVTLFFWKYCDLSEDRIRCRTPNHTESLSRILLYEMSIPASQVQETHDNYPGTRTDISRHPRHILTEHLRSKKHAGAMIGREAWQNVSLAF